MNKILTRLGALLLVALIAFGQQFVPITPTSTIPPNVGGVVYTVLVGTNPANGQACGSYNVSYQNYLTGDEYNCTNGALYPSPQRLRTGMTANSDLAGFITLSGGAGSYTFATTSYAVAPVCTATDTTAAAAVKASASATVLSITGTSTDVIAYTCVIRT